MIARRDIAIAATLTTLAVGELVLGGSERPGFHVPLAVISCAGVALRNRSPLLAAAIVAWPFVVLGVADEEIPTTAQVLAFLVVIFTIAANLPLRRALVGLAVLLTTMVVQVVLTEGAADIAWVVGVFVIPPFFVGRLYRDRRERVHELEAANRALAEERSRSERLAVEAERARIAREMHDVLSHAMSLMTVQAGAGERLAGRDPDRAAEAFRAIRTAGSDGLAELRRMLGLLHAPAEEAPQPGLASLEGLVAGIRGAGLEASLALEVEDLPAGPALAVHRIVQEALTNTVKHAGATRVAVRVGRENGAVTVEVTDNGTASKGGAGSRLGLVGMRERAAVYGGTVDAGPRPDGGFAVRARIPITD